MLQAVKPEWFGILWNIPGREWRVSNIDQWIDDVEGEYEELNLEHEARLARDWMSDNPRRAARKKLRTFFNGWLTRARRYAERDGRPALPNMAIGGHARSDDFIRQYRLAQVARGNR